MNEGLQDGVSVDCCDYILVGDDVLRSMGPISSDRSYVSFVPQGLFSSLCRRLYISNFHDVHFSVLGTWYTYLYLHVEVVPVL
jgi:hypothetical protein